MLFAYTRRHLGLAEWRSPDANAWLLMGLLAVCGIIGHLLFIKALELTPVSLVQPLNYSMLVWATVIGFAVFGELPDAWTVTGAPHRITTLRAWLRRLGRGPGLRIALKACRA